MEKDLKKTLTGAITKVTSQLSAGRFAIVTLDEPRDGVKYAVISEETKGRLALMSKSPNECLIEGTRVQIDEFQKRNESFLALNVRA